MGADLAGPAYHCGPRDLVLPGEADMAASLIFIYPRWEIESVQANLPLLAALSWVTCVVAEPREMEPRPIFCRRILCGFALFCAWILQRLRYSFVSDHFQYLAGVRPRH